MLCGISLAAGLIPLAMPRSVAAQAINVPALDIQVLSDDVADSPDYASGSYNGGLIEANGTLRNYGTLTNTGTLDINGIIDIGNSTGTKTGILNNAGTITLDGTIRLYGTALNNTGSLVITGFLVASENGQVTGDFTNNGQVDFTINSSQTYSDVMTGNGRFRKYGTETLILTGDSSNYSGETILVAGIIQIGNGGTTGALGGDFTISSSGSLVFNRSNDLSFAGVASGNGSLTKQGAGTLTLTGNNTYTGATTISAGTLQIGNGGTTGAITGNITNNAALAFNRSNDLTYAGVVSGTGSLNKSGGGMLTLSGTNTYTGATTVSNGTLAVNGSIAASNVSVQNGATFGGTGSVGGTTIASGGIHAPGNSIGTQTINGNYTLNSGSILAIEVNSAGNADQVIVNGTVNVGGATLRILGLPDNDMSGQDNYTHIIIVNDGVDAVVGTFNSINNQLAFYDASVAYSDGTGNDVTLSLTRNDTDFTDHAVTGNQSAVAAVIDDLPGADGATIRAALQGLTTAEVQRAYEQLSGDVHASTTAINGQIARQAGGQIGGRLASLNSNSSTAGTLVAAGTLSPAALAGFASAGPAASDHIVTDADTPLLALGNEGSLQTGSAIWLQAIGGKGRVDGDENIDATDYKWAGMIGGYDTRFSETTTIGIYFGYADGNSRQSGRDATLDSANLMAGVYGTHDLGDDWRLSGQAGWTRIGIDSSRNLDFGSIDRTATADYTDNALNADLELAKGFAIAPNWRAEPYGGLGVIWNRYGSFSETGADSANISRAADDDLSGTASLGVRFAGMIDTGDDKTLIPQFRLGWDHHIGPVSNSTTLAFAGTPSFTVSGSETDRDRLVGNLGFALADDDGWTLYADYQPSISENSHEHAFGAGFRMKF
ncbi:hypothetical protein SMB34_07775 [Thalassospira permensis NBRC 106175]|uniref:Autotransporter domain-containing protein n=1 Tax=Thalassospira permensis NBRC 106175 TaxID=1353532 RepID=A0ABR4TMA3_9PROT|nr:hypothetical protein SMB34_07775 [Thalassospira permensis NBRC 106175]